MKAVRQARLELSGGSTPGLKALCHAPCGALIACPVPCPNPVPVAPPRSLSEGGGHPIPFASRLPRPPLARVGPARAVPGVACLAPKSGDPSGVIGIGHGRCHGPGARRPQCGDPAAGNSDPDRDGRRGGCGLRNTTGQARDAARAPWPPAGPADGVLTAALQSLQRLCVAPRDPTCLAPAGAVIAPVPSPLPTRPSTAASRVKGVPTPRCTPRMTVTCDGVACLHSTSVGGRPPTVGQPPDRQPRTSSLQPPAWGLCCPHNKNCTHPFPENRAPN